MISNQEFQLAVAYKEAVKHDLVADKKIWLSAVWCAKVVQRNRPGERGLSLGLADEMGRSVDTVEDRAHAYWMFEKLCKLRDNPLVRQYVFQARRARWIHFSHFRELWDIQQAHDLTDEQILSLLVDVYQAEGDLSSRKLGDHARRRFGKEYAWTYYAERAMKEINKTLQHPDTPQDVREVLKVVFSELGDKA